MAVLVAHFCAIQLQVPEIKEFKLVRPIQTSGGVLVVPPYASIKYRLVFARLGRSDRQKRSSEPLTWAFYYLRLYLYIFKSVDLNKLSTDVNTCLRCS